MPSPSEIGSDHETLSMTFRFIDGHELDVVTDERGIPDDCKFTTVKNVYDIATKRVISINMELVAYSTINDIEKEDLPW